jgi:hypothetical protein
MFKKIWNWLLGKPETEKNVAHSNVVDAKKEMNETIVKFFNQNFFGQKTFTDTVVIWVANSQPEKQSYVRDKEFETELCTELENRQLVAISKVQFLFKTENPPQELGLAEIAKGIYIQLLAVNTQPIESPKEVCDKAKITIVTAKGSLMKNSYILDAEKQTEYNIGRGVENNNHIVIKEHDPANSEINSRVSRLHAKIVFIVGKGFCLQSRNEDNRTIINRNNLRITDLKDLNTKALLQTYDEIELGKSVCLLFEHLTPEMENKIAEQEAKRNNDAFKENDLGI